MSFPKPHFHWLSTSHDCDSPWPEICLFPPGRSHPSFTLHCIPQQVLKHSFLRLLQKRLSLGEMLGQRSSLRHQRTHNTHLAHPCPSEAGSLPASQSSSYITFPVPCLRVPSSTFFKKGDILGPAPGLYSLPGGGQK